MEPTLLSRWENFHVIVGSAAGALIGLQFVVMTLINESAGGSASSKRVVGAFATPTIVHFGAVVLIAAGLSAPWPGVRGPALLLGAAGLAGTIYAVVVIVRMRRQPTYEPVLEDWIWHALLPLIAYAGVFGAAFAVPRAPLRALFVVAAAMLLLLFTGIHNAWDTVTYLATERPDLIKRSVAPRTED
jgi:hypothetical protein